MKTRLRGILLIVLLMFCPVSAQETYYKVLNVVDEDTFYVDFYENNSTVKENKIRVNGIDTFETKMNAALKKANCYKQYKF